MQLQSDKNVEEKRAQARKALMGEKKNPATENKERINKKKKTIEKEIHESKPKEVEKIPQIIPKKNKEKIINAQFFENIRPKNKKNEDISIEKKKKIERIVPKKKTESKQYNIQTIRTYKSDIIDTVKKGKESLSNIRIKEKAKKVKEIKRTPKGGSIFKYVAGAGALVVVVAVVVGFLFVYQTNKIGSLLKIFNKTSVKLNKPTITTPTMFSLLDVDIEKKINISIGNINIPEIVQQEIIKSSSTNGVENIYLYKIIDSGNVKQEEGPASIKDIVSLWKNKIPDILLRSLGNKFMLGVYSTKTGKNVPFLILTTNSYNQTFAGMIKWESTMNEDIYSLFGFKPKQTNGSFLDKVIGGENTRMSVDLKGKTQLVYSFVNKKTIVVTTNEEVFKGIVSRVK